MPKAADTQALVAKHLAFKERAQDLLNTYIDARDWCITADTPIHEAGLVARDVFYQSNPHLEMNDLVGEETEEEFEAWRLKAFKVIDATAKHHRLTSSESYRKVMTRAGLFFEATPVRVVVDGTFSLPIDVKVYPGEDPTAAVNLTKMRDSVYNLFGGRDVNQDGSPLRWTTTAEEPKQAETVEA